MKVINPVIKTIDPLFSPVPVSKVIKGQNGIVAIKNTRQEIDYGEIVLLSVLSTIVDEDNSIADPESNQNKQWINNAKEYKNLHFKRGKV